MNYWWVECKYNELKVFCTLKVWQGKSESVAHCSSTQRRYNRQHNII